MNVKKTRPKRGKKSPAPKKEDMKLIEIGLKIRKERTRRGLSVAELSKMCGIAPPQIYKIEMGSNCTLKTLMKVRSALRIKITL